MTHQDWQTTLAAAPPDASASRGVAHLASLAAVRFSGRDARDFLQGYLTCDTADLEPDRLTPTALCNLKGRVVMNGWCVPDTTAQSEQDVLLILHASLVDRLAEFLHKYLMFSRTTLTDLREHGAVLGTLDTDAVDTLALDDRRGLLVTQDPAAAGHLWDTWPRIAEASWLEALTADGWPLVSAPVSEAFLPQMLDLGTLGAIDFEKGCYLGQEVVARAQHRGKVKRILARLSWSGDQVPAVGSEITDADGRAVGVVLQCPGASPTSGSMLAVLSREAPHVLRQGDVSLNRVP